MIERAPTPDFYLMESLLTSEEIAIRARMREFAETYVRPRAAEAWDSGVFPIEIVPALGAIGIVGGMVEGYGCPTMSSVAYGLATMELARVDSSFATFFGVHSGLSMATISQCGSEQQKRHWLPVLARCERIGAFALTEPNHGSDAANLETSARLDGDAYVLNGVKRWIGNADLGGVTVVWARADDGIAGFLVECPTPGFDAVPITGKLGKRGCTQAEITMTDCRVPVSARMPVGGFRSIAEILSKTRHNVAWEALGEALACYEIALAHAVKREQFGKPIGQFQLVQQKLVRMLGEITKAQLLSIQLGRLRDTGQATPGMTAFAKSNNASVAREVAATAREILGGVGILQEYEVMRHMNDLEAVYTYEGTNDVNTLIVGREITGLSAFV